MFVSSGKDFTRIMRLGRSGDGAIWVDRLKDNVKWERDGAPLISGKSNIWPSGPYINTPVVAPNGSVHLFVVWRLHSKATSGGVVINSGIDAACSPDGMRTIWTSSGVQLAVPMTPSNADRIIAVPLGSNLINQSTAAIMPDGSAAFVTYWDDGDGIPQYRFGWKDKHRWRIATVSRFTTPFALDAGGTLPLPHSRPEIIVHPDGRITVIYRSIEFDNRLMATQLKPPHYALTTSRTEVLVDSNLGFYEPVLDRAAWSQRNELALYIQHCRQGFNADGRPDHHAEPAFIASFRPSM
jgi:hypothetical protein